MSSASRDAPLIASLPQIASRPLIASLPMYDWPEVRQAMDLFWRDVAAHLRSDGIRAPRALKRAKDYAASWLAPRLLLSQTCGYPYATRLRGKVQLVATPCYGVADCSEASYSSVIVARRRGGPKTLADLAEATAVINSEDSQSGHWALRAALAADRKSVGPARVIRSGAHRASLRMVAAGRADVAAIDAVCWALAKRHEKEAVSKLAVIAVSPAAPGLPFITAPSTDAETLAALRRALERAIAAPSQSPPRNALFLRGIAILPDKAYDRVLKLRDKALGRPFPQP